MNVVFNGAIVAAKEARASLLDEALQWGMGVFETMLAVDGVVDGLELHIERLNSGVMRLGYDLFQSELCREWIHEVLASNHLLDKRARVRITSFGENYCVQASEVIPCSDVCNVVISDYLRNEYSAVAGMKCASYAENRVALSEGKAQGADDVIFLNTGGEVCESSVANVFIVVDGVLFTPSVASGCLPGVTRALIIERARKAGIEVHEARLMLGDLMGADEVFLSNAVNGVRAVKYIGEAGFQGHAVTDSIREIYLNHENERGE